MIVCPRGLAAAGKFLKQIYIMVKYEYTLIKSSRKTISIKVTEENKIIVRAPLSATRGEVERLLTQKRGWLERAMAFNNSNSLAQRSVKDYREAYVGGRLFPVFKSTRNYVDGDGVHVTGLRGFKAAYVNCLGGQFLSEFKKVQAACGLECKSVSFRSYRSMWGCCDGACNITFNFKLLMLPPELQKYVMVHELCHTVFHDHSQNFWTLVSRFVPSWKSARRELKSYAFLVKLY